MHTKTNSTNITYGHGQYHMFIVLNLTLILDVKNCLICFGGTKLLHCTHLNNKTNLVDRKK